MTEYLISGTRFLASSLASFAWSSPWRERKAAVKPAPPAVETVSVEQKRATTNRDCVGTLSAGVDVSIRARVSGYLLRQHYREGQIVKQDDLLFELDDRPFQAALHEATARLQETEQAVRRCRQWSAANETRRQQLDQATQANLTSRAAVDEARMNLRLTRIRSPIEGVAGPAKVQAGNLVRADSGPLTTVTRIDPICVHIFAGPQWLTEILPRIHAKGGPLSADSESSDEVPLALLLPSGSVYPHIGRLRPADQRQDGRIGALRAVAEFPNPQGVLLPGMVVRLRLELGRGTARLLAPHRRETVRASGSGTWRL